MHTITKISFVFFTFLLFACNSKQRPSSFLCKDCSPSSVEYKNELAHKLETEGKGLKYTFNRYVENEGREYLDMQFKGDDFEASGLVLVSNWDKLKGIKRTKGLGYSGAELKGLQLGIQRNSSGAELVFKDLEKIVD